MRGAVPRVVEEEEGAGRCELPLPLPLMEEAVRDVRRRDGRASSEAPEEEDEADGVEGWVDL
jgi:hypothetical protein